MPTVSVKLAESSVENHSAFMADALRSRKQVVASGRVVDGTAFCAYLKAKARGIKATRPQAVRLDL